MSFNSANLMLIGQGVGGVVRQWSYITLDSIGTVCNSDYFPDTSQLQIGDLVEVTVVNSLDPASRTTAEMVALVVGTSF